MKEKTKRTAAAADTLPALPRPRGITVAQAAELLQYSQDSVLRMIYSGELVAIQPRGARGRRWLIDEHSLRRVLDASWEQARAATASVQARLMKKCAPVR